MQAYSITGRNKGKHLADQDGLDIQRWQKKEWRFNSEISRLLNNAPGTIDRDMKRGDTQLKQKVNYSAKKAQENY